MKNLFLLFIFSFSIISVSCDDGPTRTGSPRVDPNPTDKNPLSILSTAQKGKIYYDANCGGCHSAGTDDPSRAYKATNLKSKKSLSLIKGNMSDTNIYGGIDNLMNRFSKVLPNRITELKAYLSQP